MKKKVMGNLEKCYSIAPLMYQGRRHILVAAEKVDRCILFDEEGNEEETVWEGPGGTMTMVQVPGTDGEFLATQQFYSPNDSGKAKIVAAVPGEKDGWAVRTLAELPFVHRFDIIESGKERYLFACTLKSGHGYRDDWSHPGKIYAARLPENLGGYNGENQLELEVIREGLLKNHGYYRVEENGGVSALVSCENGVFRFYPPAPGGQGWKEEQLLDTPASDAAMMDLDGDGEMELVVISPFHGAEASVYKLRGGTYKKVYQYPEKAEFLHAIWSGTLAGRPVIVLGHRKGARRLIAVMWKGGGFTFRTIDDDCGPANVYGYRIGERDILIATNRETDEIARYEFEQGDL
ncbi:hypothetical protein [Luxibacter massiliensis]|uniref:hypothetical protein n=1 Tax=Luxibacter massiliensis TaxID=2219695 RepID=UPI000F062FEA|nr:hypothetical protein [Luxibacter massiliensis]